MTSLKPLFAAAALMLAVNVASADPMPAAAVGDFLGAGSFKATAGSTFSFKSDGTFSISHGSSGSESGTYQILGDGSVSRLRDGAKSPDVFFIDVDAKGKKTLVYTAGKYKGKKFKLR